MQFVTTMSRKVVLSRLLLVLAVLVAAVPGSSAATLTAAAVFSSNASGENWNGLIWNTVGQDGSGMPDTRNVWNLYWSSSADPNAPVFVNGYNDSRTNIAIPLSPGVHTFTVFGESAFTPLDPQQHVVLNLYFDGQSTPGTSALGGPSCPTPCAASHWNGLDLLGNSGAQEAGTLTYAAALALVTVTEFEWITDRTDIDKVWSHWHDAAPYNSGSDTPRLFRADHVAGAGRA